MLIKVKVYPGSKKDKIIQKAEDSFEIMVREKPENNKANQRVIEIIAQYFNLPINKIRIVKGTKKRNKIIEIFD